MSSQKFNDIVAEMMLALRANIEYLKKNGSSQTTIKNGKLVNVIDGGYIYDFELSYLQDFDEDADIEVKVGQQNVSGKISAATESTIQVILDGHVGDTIASAVLIISNYYLLERLFEHLSDVRSEEKQHTELADKVLKLTPALVAQDTDYVINDPDVNESQERAIQLSLGSEVTYIWGPPGTGKSETIARIVEGLKKEGLSTLLIAHTNAATDSVMLKAVEYMEGDADYIDGKFLRLGSIKTIDEELKTKKVIPEVIMEEKARPIREEMDNIQTQLNDNAQKLKDTVIAEEKIATAQKYQHGIEKAKAYIADKKGEIESINEAVITQQDLITQINARIREYQAKGSFSKLFAGTNLDKLTQQKTAVLHTLAQYREQASHLEAQREQAKVKLKEMKQTHLELELEIKYLPVYLNEDEVKATKAENKALAEQLKALQDMLAALGDKLILEAKVIATTLTKTYMYKPLLLRDYDCVILDEASMAPLPAVVAAAGMAKKKVIVVGDFFQLPPIAKHQVDARNKSDEEAQLEKELVEKWLKRDIFNFVGIDDDIRKNRTPDPWLTQLNTQYRMHPDISALVNSLVYENYNKDFKLLNGDKTKNNGQALLDKQPLANAHLGVYDTTKLGPIATKSDSGSWFNLTHALVAVELAKQAIKSGYKSIGIISAYRAQINLIQHILKDELPNDKDKVRADTVHRFQGGAQEIIIFDVTTAMTNSMYDDQEKGGDDEKLINVAFSRSKDKCIVLADVKAVKANHSRESLILAAIEYCERNSFPVVDAQSLLTDFSADDRTEHWLANINNVDDLNKQIENAKLFDQADFYPNFIRDLLNAEQEVIIQSAFITKRRSDTLKPIFHRLLQRGVRIYILTRVPVEHDDGMRQQAEKELAEYEKMGIIVLPFTGKIHQKYASIDRKILWDGSLNILSQRDSQEVMRRYSGIQAVDQYLSFQRLDKNIGTLGENKLRHCDVCTLPGSWLWTKKVRGRLWTFCLTGVHAPGKEPRVLKDKSTKYQEMKDKQGVAAQVRQGITQNASGQLLCPVHKRILLEKTGRFGKYWECPNKKECNCTINPVQLKRLLGSKAQATLEL